MKNASSEGGQIVIIAAFALVVLLVAAGLAIDGGSLLLQRRSMQNAADSGALAGTRRLAEAICDPSGASDADIASQVNSFAERNGVPDTNGVPGDAVNANVVAHYVEFVGNQAVGFVPPAVVGGGTIPNGATGISVTTIITQSNVFMGLVGQSDSPVGAYAMAVTGPPMMAGGLRPIGLPVQVVQDLDEGDSFTINMENNCDGDNCSVSYIRPSDNQAVTHAHRGWLNLHYVWNQGEEDEGFPRAVDPNIGTGWGGPHHSGLMDWMLNPPDIVLYADCPWDLNCRYGDFIAAKPGLSWGALTGGGNPSLCEQISEEISILPIYDEVPPCEPLEHRPDCSPQGGQSVGYVYHIIGFSAVHITGCDQGAGGVHNINMDMVETIIGMGQVSSQLATGFDPNGSGGCEFDLQVVTLWE